MTFPSKKTAFARMTDSLPFDRIALPSIGFVIVLVIVGATTSPSFLGPFNTANVLVQVTPLILIALGQMIVVGSGGIDLSVGSVASLSAVATAMLFDSAGPVIAIAAGLAIAIAAGLVNGLLVTFGLEPILVTLATLSAFQGVAYLITPVPDGTVPSWYAGIAQQWMGIPLALPIVILIAVAVGGLFRSSRTGADILSIGGDANIAHLLGVRVRWTLVKTYVLAALLAGAAGLFLIARARSGDPTIGARFMLDSLAAVVVGGTMLAGGRISVLGTIFGAFALGLVPNVMNLAGVPAFYQTATKGIILLAAILLPVLLTAAVARRRRSASVHQMIDSGPLLRMQS